MEKIYNTEKKKFITYNHYKSNKKNMPHVMFLHGLMSNMNGIKAVFLENYCKKHNYNFITFDNFGHGKSSGNFLDETIGSWLMGVELVLNKLVIQPTIIIGSSMGAWLAILAAIKFPSKICGLIALAPALDFTETIWKNLTEIQKIQMQQQKWLEFNGRDCNRPLAKFAYAEEFEGDAERRTAAYSNVREDSSTASTYKLPAEVEFCKRSNGVYPISYQLILEAKNHLLLNSNSINLKKPVHLVHGMLDVDVPYTISSKLVEKITSDIVVMKLIKDGHHNLARESDLAIIANSLEEIINY